MCRSVCSPDEVLCVQCLLFRDVCEAEGSGEVFSASERRDPCGEEGVIRHGFPGNRFSVSKMAALLPEILFECNGQAPAPSKDFYQLIVSRSQVILRWWKISLRSEFRTARPGELKESHEDFVDDSTLHAQIGIIFGQKTLSYVTNLCQGRYDFLARLSESLILYILTFLDLEDITKLSQVSRRFQKICNSDKLWEHIVERSCDRVTPEMRSLAQDLGWKQFFYTNKLQLQLQLRRRRKRQENQEMFLD